MAKSKGFKTGKNNTELVKIRFAEGHDLHGLEIDVQKRVPIGVIFGAQAGDLAGALRPMVKRIRRWNLVDDDDNDAPITVEAFGEQFDDAEATAIVQAWIQAVSGVSDPLEEPSSDTVS